MSSLSTSTTQGTALQKFDKLKTDITVFVRPTLAITINSKEDAEKAMDTARTVKNFMKKVEERRKELVKPLNDEVKRINEYVKGITAPLEQSEQHLKGVLVKWEGELEKLRQDALKKADEEKTRLETEAADRTREQQEEAEAIAMFAPAQVGERAQAAVDVESERMTEEVKRTHAKTVSNISAMRVSGTSKPWTFEVKDEAAVPREYLMVDEKKIREAVRNGAREIAGVSIFQETKIAVR